VTREAKSCRRSKHRGGNLVMAEPFLLWTTPSDPAK